MTADRSDVVRASEIATYCYCQRAWSYQRQGIPLQNVDDLTEGLDYHQRHAQTLSTVRFARAAAFLFTIIAIAILILR